VPASGNFFAAQKVSPSPGRFLPAVDGKGEKKRGTILEAGGWKRWRLKTKGAATGGGE
jgi:hypothetical protein